jgi:hypothetical protein
MLKAAAREELERRAAQNERDPRQAEWDRNARTMAESSADWERRKADPAWARQQDAARDQFFRQQLRRSA